MSRERASSKSAVLFRNRLGVNVLFAALVAVVVGSLGGEYICRL
jgi:hypothetical protein